MIDLRELLTADTIPPSIPGDTHLTLIAVALDDPLGYIFESADWKAALGAARLTRMIGERIRAALPSGSLLLSGADLQSQWLALSHEQTVDWSLITPLAAEITGTMTASVTGLSLTARQVFNGLYRTPTAIIGIPGMAGNQARVNRYYGVQGGVTLPDTEQVTARRHFGEALTLILHLINHARDDRQIFPFYECLPLVERCAICRSRPAESRSNTIPLCGICRRKRQAIGAVPDLKTGLAIVNARAIGIDGRPAEVRLREQTTPAAYSQLCRALTGAWTAIDHELDRSLPGTPVWRSEIESWWVVPTAKALTFAVTVGKKFATAVSQWPDEIARMTVQIGMAFDHPIPERMESGGAALTYRSALATLRRPSSIPTKTPLKPEIVIDVGPGKSVRSTRYTMDMALHLQSALQILQSETFNASLFDDLSRQSDQRTADLYFEAARARLDDRSRQAIDAVTADYSPVWGARSEQFFAAWSDTFSILKAIETLPTDRSS